MVKTRETRALLRTAKLIDTWFLGKFQIGLYRGCQHACVYCDGRFEKYNFEGEFGTDIEIKVNGLDLLPKELARIKEPGFVFVGSGITDAYQPLEADQQLSRRAMELLVEKKMPVHVLTKSALIERDLDLFEKMAATTPAIISFSIGMDDEKHRKLLEPRTAPLAERWRILQKVKGKGIFTGVMMMPVIPFISDSKAEMERILQKAKNAGVNFVLFGGMTLKAGRQKEFFLNFIREKFPQLEQKFQDLYHLNDPYGLAIPSYYTELENNFYELARKYRMPFRIPHEVFKGVVPLYTEAALLLAHIGDYLYALGTRRKAYQFACYAIQKWAFELKKKIGRKKSFHYSQIENEFKQQVETGEITKISGIGDAIHNMLVQFLETGKIPYYERVRKDFLD